MCEYWGNLLQIKKHFSIDDSDNCCEKSPDWIMLEFAVASLPKVKKKKEKKKKESAKKDTLITCTGSLCENWSSKGGAFSSS